MTAANRMNDSQTTGEVMSLESILERLGRVVENLEKGDLPLEESLKIFEEGVRLTREGQRRLDAAERRIEVLLSNEPGVGEPPLGPAPGAR
jgi:exodeoxyribonuclease VII small subunit